MFDGKIDFMDFNKIKINYGGKLTCRKIFKRKYVIFLIISIIIIICLASFYSVKNKKISGINMEINELNEKKAQIENSCNLIQSQNKEEEVNLFELQDKVESMKKDLKNLSQKDEEIKNKNSQLISEKNKLEKESSQLTSQLKTEMELKNVYEQKITSLTALLESLKVEYNKLLENKGDKKEEEDPLNIINSKIINSIEVANIEKIIKGTISKKCFDGVEDKFNPNIFHNKCDYSPILVLIKTDNNERIGAFTKVSLDGLEIKRDPSTALFNIDNGKFYALANPEYSTILCNPEELPHFGIDLQIKTNGEGINSFPQNYGDKDINFSEELTANKNFKIENLEIYKVEL